MSDEPTVPEGDIETVDQTAQLVTTIVFAADCEIVAGGES